MIGISVHDQRYNESIMRVSKHCQQYLPDVLMLQGQLCQHAETESASTMKTNTPSAERFKGSGLSFIVDRCKPFFVDLRWHLSG